ncbi:hypothetical protein BGX38DRAFT_327779 [Terfezia claveryi]|nr:hypothetical protein BGX38DRAFT_327779 [Terfezia claveryi]
MLSMTRFPTRTEVDSANNAKMRQLAGKVEIFEANDGGTTSTDTKMRDRLLSSCMAPQRIALKINSQVMLIKNVDETLVNGSLGRVVGFMNDRTFELLMSEGGIEDYINGVEDEGESLVSKRRARLKSQLVAQAAADTSKKWPLVQFIIPDGKEITPSLGSPVANL